MIFDRSSRLFLPVHVGLAPKTDLRPDRIEISHGAVIQACGGFARGCAVGKRATRCG
jgi:hypothetical protein